MKVAETRGAHKCAEKMEREATSLKRRYCCTTVMNIISSLLSVASLAFCILLSLQTSEIKDRVLDLETRLGEHVFHRVPGFSVDQFNSLIQERVDELLSQRSYEHFAKIRIARQVSPSPDCNCPPGSPGKRGRRGRNGEPATLAL
ncbi:collagen alpha-1(XXV) chain-like isoform X2 [Salvelinus namaycush]|uniref:Collagen alpha-1(XXV) chain-like isoform X2 n=1 Tax=Salvelinus namaycush TaxID=8040 RepID=A0A8U0QY97_SALNM|nr:collagen alpha-1(XXV) chain-like isoform X2 [Salvelinus namaycush]